MTGKELVEFARNAPNRRDYANILARFIRKNEAYVVSSLEKAGYSQTSIDFLREAIEYPTDPNHIRKMEKMLSNI